jgi:hypothetical protein
MWFQFFWTRLHYLANQHPRFSKTRITVDLVFAKKIPSHALLPLCHTILINGHAEDYLRTLPNTASSIITGYFGQILRLIGKVRKSSTNKTLFDHSIRSNDTQLFHIKHCSNKYKWTTTDTDTLHIICRSPSIQVIAFMLFSARRCCRIDRGFEPQSDLELSFAKN